MKKLILFLGLPVFLFVACSTQSLAEGAVNAGNPGEEINLKNYIKLGKTNIVDFYSDFCPPCRRISPLLSQLGKKKNDITVIKVDINRKGRRGIDWGSPLARQYKLSSIPHFKIYDKTGKLTLEGNDAFRQVVQWIQQEGIVK